MTRLLLLIITACLSLAISAKDFYLTGGFNGWQPNQSEYKFSEDAGIYTLFLSSLTGDFKITTSAWEEQYGCDYKIEYGKTYKCVQTGNGSNILLPEDPATNVTLTFDYNAGTLRVDKSYKLYLTGDFNNWLILPAYAFNFNDGVYTLRTPSFTGNFLIVSADKAFSYAYPGVLKASVEHPLFAVDAGMYFQGIPGASQLLITINPNSTFTDAVEDIELEEIETTTEYYTLDGIKVENPSHGILIRRCGNKTEKIRQ